MFHFKASKFAILATVCLLGIGATRSAHAQFATEWSGGSVINLGGLPGSTSSYALAINNAGQAVGWSVVGGTNYATEWSGGAVINLGGLPGSTVSAAFGINDAGQAVGYSVVGGTNYATEWSGGAVINLGGPGSVAEGINNAGEVVGEIFNGGPVAVIWSGGSLLGGLTLNDPSKASGINDAGRLRHGNCGGLEFSG